MVQALGYGATYGHQLCRPSFKKPSFLVVLYQPNKLNRRIPKFSLNGLWAVKKKRKKKKKKKKLNMAERVSLLHKARMIESARILFHSFPFPWPLKCLFGSSQILWMSSI